MWSDNGTATWGSPVCVVWEPVGPQAYGSKNALNLNVTGSLIWEIDCVFFFKHLFNTIKLFKNIKDSWNHLKPFETSKCVGGILYFLPLKSALVHRFKR